MEKVQEIFARSESKYLLTKEQYNSLMTDIKDYIKPDELFPHSETKSIYFDTNDFSLARTCIEKPEYRTKIRLRGYGNIADKSLVFFEQKSKYLGTTYKRRQELNYDIAKHYGNYLNKNESKYSENNNELFNELPQTQISKEIDFIIKDKHLVPKVLVQYSRDSYSSLNELDLRITFDNNIRYNVANPSLSQEGTKKLLDENYRIMEIKTLFSIPPWLSKALNKYKIYPSSFSKYTNIYQKEFIH